MEEKVTVVLLALNLLFFPSARKWRSKALYWVFVVFGKWKSLNKYLCFVRNVLGRRCWLFKCTYVCIHIHTYSPFVFFKQKKKKQNYSNYILTCKSALVKSFLINVTEIKCCSCDIFSPYSFLKFFSLLTFYANRLRLCCPATCACAVAAFFLYLYKLMATGKMCMCV